MIADVAREAGVYYRIVSRTLNNKPEISADTHAHVPPVVTCSSHRSSMELRIWIPGNVLRL